MIGQHSKQLDWLVKPQIWRTEFVAGDPDRDWSLIWCRGQPTHSNDPTVTVQPGLWLWRGDIQWWEGVVMPVLESGTTRINTEKFITRHGTWQEDSHWISFRIPPSTPPGEYNLTLHGRLISKVTVIKDAYRAVIHLKPGEHIQQQPLKLAPYSTLRGYGTVFRGQVHVADGCSVYGVTFDHEQPFVNVPKNAVFKDCIFKRGRTWHSDIGTLWQDCTWDCAGTFAYSGLYFRCSWVGIHQGVGHSFQCEGSDRLAILDCTFTRTDRGPIIRSWWGANNDGLAAGIFLDSIYREHNGCELMCGEGPVPGINRWCFIGWRSNACPAAFTVDCQFKDNLISQFQLYGSAGIVLTGAHGDQTGNVIQHSEFRGGGIHFAERATHNRVIECGFLDWRPSSANQFDGHPSRYVLAGKAVIQATGPNAGTNTTQGVTVIGEPAGVAKSVGVSGW